MIHFKKVPEMMEGSRCGVMGLKGLGGSGMVWEGPGRSGRVGGSGRVGRVFVGSCRVREGLGGSGRV